ncbi:hypothetical protein [Paludisphaera sp.]|uniref:hypothetical protein n=1 Tax=Paludisphaera sp. TaxID=2017432 RepID=UPI00301C534C
MDTSDRRLNAFDNPAKTASREATLAFLRNAANRLWIDASKEKIRCSWCELMGSTGHLTREILLREGIIDPRQFVGVDLSGKLAAGHALAGPTVLQGDLLSLLNSPELSEVGVLNFDAYYAVASPKLQADLQLTRGKAARSLRLFGEFCLILNADLDAAVRRKLRPSTALRKHAEVVSEIYHECGLCRISPELLLPSECETPLDAGDTGRFGMFEVYRGRRGGHRMALLRLMIS